MKYYFSYTPRHWEFGFGFYLSEYYICAISDVQKKHPSEFAFLLGPFSFCLTFGNLIEVVR